MTSKKGIEFEKEWISIRKSLSGKNKIILEILSFAFIAAHTSKSHIKIEKITKKLDDGTEIKTSFIYKMTVNDD